ncbi:MAG TPA: hypothetical protein VMV23_01065 [Candidatus Nanopelagicaceae bacterium]|nr:hypothetical protein [Candidatus Nanopelagicaceae bacterium]
MRLRQLRAVAVGCLTAATCLAAMSGCGALAPGHLPPRRRRAPRVSQEPAAGLPSGVALAQDLKFSGPRQANVAFGYATQCGVYPGLGYNASVDIAVGSRTVTLDLQLPNYNGPGTYTVAASSAINLAVATVSGFQTARSGWVVVDSGGRGGTLQMELPDPAAGHRSPLEKVVGSWSCAQPGAGYGRSGALPTANQAESMTVSGALQGFVSSAAVPPGQLAAPAPNCGPYGGSPASKFNAAMVVVLDGHHYVLDVQVQQFRGPGLYYPAFTTATLPIQSNWATAAVYRTAAPDLPGRIPSSNWAAVGGDFQVYSSLDSGMAFIRFMNRTGSSFIVSGSWSC